MGTVHNLIEDEFYKVENFNSKEDMLIKTYAYLIYFNNFRKNRNRNNKTPREIFKDDMKKYWNNSINFKPIIVDHFIKDITYIKKHGYFYCLPLNDLLKPISSQIGFYFQNKILFDFFNIIFNFWIEIF